MIINCKIDEGAFVPSKAHNCDAGMDIRTPERVLLAAHNCAVVNTGVHLEIPAGYCGFVKSKSGLNVNHGIRCEGVVDSGFTGSIVCKLYNDSDENYIFDVGDKITQVVILPTPDIDLVVTDVLAPTERGDSGFGSTGK